MYTAPHKRERSALTTSRLPYVLSAIIFLTAVVRIWLSSLNHDAAWLVWAGERVRGGAQLYTDIIEVNPPLIFWLGRPAAWISDVTGLSLGGGYKAWVFLLAAVSLILSAQLLRRMTPAPGLWALPVLTFALTWLAADQFAQREHFMAILILPYVLLVALRAGGARASVKSAAFIAILAAAGLCIKPYYMAVPAALELYLLFKIGLRPALKRPEPWVIAGCALAYVGAIAVLTPQYFGAAFGYISDVYSAGFKADPEAVILGLWPLWLTVLIGAVCTVRLRPTFSAIAPVYMATSLTVLALLCGYFIQFKGWTNHAYPVLAYALFPAFAGMAALWRHRDGLKIYAGLMGIGVAALAVFAPLNATWQRADLRDISAYLKTQHEAKSIFIMSANLYDGFPLVTEHNLEWGSRFASLWLTPGLQAPRDHLRADLQARLAEAEAFTKSALAHDFAASKPDAILVDVRERKNMFRAPYDYIADFSTDPDFAREFSKYKQADWPGKYALYVRRTGAPD